MTYEYNYIYTQGKLHHKDIFPQKYYSNDKQHDSQARTGLNTKIKKNVSSTNKKRSLPAITNVYHQRNTGSDNENLPNICALKTDMNCLQHIYRT